ncbi:MAG: RNA methyltransferase [Actinomycetia bacterium]|nr:RNA methyltransferase [Actinomycetes bacterium]
MAPITSKDNPRVKEARKLLTRKGRRQSGSYLIEGFHVLEEALRAGITPIETFAASEATEKLPPGVTAFTPVTEAVLKSLSDTQTPQGVVAVLAMDADTADVSGSKYLVLENIQDPGNVGTMVRTADAAGFDGVFTIGETADIYSPKVMRAMQGSQFHLPVVCTDTDELLAALKTAGLPVLVSTLSADSVPCQAVSAQRFALVMGNESRGVTEDLLRAADARVRIDMPGRAESLNVAVAAGILMFSLGGI